MELAGTVVYHLLTSPRVQREPLTRLEAQGTWKDRDPEIKRDTMRSCYREKLESNKMPTDRGLLV